MSRHLAKLKDWHAARGFRMVEMIVEPQPPGDGYEDYHVATEVRFVPRSPDMMQAEIWITDEDHLGLNIDRYDRIAARVGVRTNATRFVAGSEPGEMDFDHFLQPLELVAAGEIVIDYLRLLPYGLIAAAKAPKERLRSLKKVDASINMVGVMRARPFPGFTRLRYEPWR